VVYAANGNDVETAIIDGRVVMRDRVILTVDEVKVKHVIAAGKAWIGRSVSLDMPWPIARA
jgi:cytosine/adenosine deaminase-related metal-dependent hydrolase